jgi:hypothetical protein
MPGNNAYKGIQPQLWNQLILLEQQTISVSVKLNS